MKTIAIIGRPNVGKSTLFNRLIGKQKAIVDETAGTTRDWRDEITEIMEQKFRVIDTAGLEKAETGKLQAAMFKSTESAAAQADILLFLYQKKKVFINFILCIYISYECIFFI